ncbi:metallothionein-4 [Drosophila hydei]|uniref:Metallothionein-4 n=1 Tax=Drosophila hydei TaxID=7224 RepID=A0A6J1LDT0_DROHY|nr:metallothionein-4 [Drosophila hydei]XP_030080728.1 metallothionein-4 [Drosophila hydei]
MPCKGCGNNCQCTSGKCGGNCAGNQQCQCAGKTAPKCCQTK